MLLPLLLLPLLLAAPPCMLPIGMPYAQHQLPVCIILHHHKNAKTMAKCLALRPPLQKVPGPVVAPLRLCFCWYDTPASVMKVLLYYSWRAPPRPQCGPHALQGQSHTLDGQTATEYSSTITPCRSLAVNGHEDAVLHVDARQCFTASSSSLPDTLAHMPAHRLHQATQQRQQHPACPTALPRHMRH
jgi:hypothetical protein